MSRTLALLTVVVAVMVAYSAAGQAVGAKNEIVPFDALTFVVDPYDVADQKIKFLRAAGKTGELDAKAFDVDQKAGDNLIQPYETWATAVGFDKNKNGTLDWFEFDAYRQAMRKAVFVTCDNNRDGNLSGDERVVALKLLAGGKLVIKPGVDLERAGALPPGGASADAKPALSPHDAELEAILAGDTLTDEQKQKIRKIIDERDKDLAKFNERYGQRLKELYKAKLDAYASRDSAKIRAASDAYDALKRRRQQIEGAFLADLRESDALTGKHRTRLWVAREFNDKLESLWAAKLTEKQQKELAAFCDELKSKGLTADWLDKFAEKAVGLMTDEQKTATVRTMLAVWGGGLDKVTLSDEQRAQLKAALAAARKELDDRNYMTLDAKARHLDAFIGSLSAGQKDQILRARIPGLPNYRENIDDGLPPEDLSHLAHVTYPDGGYILFIPYRK